MLPDNKTQNWIYQTLRIAIAMCFIGHGAFGIITKPVWLNYFAVFGIGKELGYHLMPVMGACDIVMGVTMLVFPLRAIALFLVIWGFITASLRPLSGEPIAELIERAGNFGTPLAFLVLLGASSRPRDWFTLAGFREQTNARNIVYPKTILKCTACLLLLGHGWLNIIEKKSLLSQYAALGFSHPESVAQFAGIFEMACALLVFIRPNAYLLLFLFTWKMASELFYPHYELFEWIERGGSYGSLLALFFLVRTTAPRNTLDNKLALR